LGSLSRLSLMNCSTLPLRTKRFYGGTITVVVVLVRMTWLEGNVLSCEANGVRDGSPDSRNCLRNSTSEWLYRYALLMLSITCSSSVRLYGRIVIVWSVPSFIWFRISNLERALFLQLCFYFHYSIYQIYLQFLKLLHLCLQII
jgi:hypothetical protein